jgi:hypothetical protein
MNGTGARLTSWRSSRVAPRRRDDGGGKNPRAAALGFRRDATQVAAARVEEILGCGQLIKARGSLLGVQAKQGGCAPGRRGRESDSSLSPARPRVGDDRRGPPVIGCGAARAGEAGWRGWASRAG